MILQSERLALRPFGTNDQDALIQLCNDPEIARFTETIPSPYTQTDAIAFIKRSQQSGTILAITLSETIVGCISLTPDQRNDRAAMGFWIGKNYRRQGICTEAGKLLIDVAFQELGLHKIFAGCLLSNLTCFHVLHRMGLRQEGVLLGHVKKDNRYHDCAVFGIIKGRPVIDKDFAEAFL